MTRADAIASLARAGLYRGQWALDDDTYDPVSAAFIVQAGSDFPSFLPAELRTPVSIGGGKTVETVLWLPEVFDCDNIARAFGVFIDICMARDAVTMSRARGNIAAGKFNFNPTPTTGHAANWFIDHEGIAHVFDAARQADPELTITQLATIFSGESI